MSVKVEYGDLTEIQMQQDEIDEIVSSIKSMKKDGLMVEWGSGGSTIKWLESMQKDQKIVTIEHNTSWYRKIRNTMKLYPDYNTRHELILSEEKHGFKHGYADIIEEHPFGLEDYIVPDEKILDADIFFIDGIARAACAMMVLAASKKKDPVIYLHDWVGREAWYAWAVNRFPKHEKVGHTLVRLYK